MLIGCLFLVTSCSDDDDSSAVASLQVIKSDVSFTAIATTGTIEVQSTSAITTGKIRIGVRLLLTVMS